MSRRRTLAPPFCATMCSQSLAMFDALTTSITLSSNRYTRQSSTKVPCSVSSPEYWASPGRSAATSLQVTRCTNALRSGPVTSNSPMCDTSNMPARSRTARCSAPMPAGYVTGISNPAKGTIFAPSVTWMSCSGVRLSGVDGVGSLMVPVSSHQGGEQGLLNVQPVLRLVPYAGLPAFNDLGGDFLAPVGGQAVQEDGVGVGEPHQLRVHRIAAKRVAAGFCLGLLPHRSPHVGVHDMRALGRLLGHFGHRHPGVPRGALELLAIGFVPLGTSEAQLEPEDLGRLEPAVGHVVPVPDPGDALPLPGPQRLAYGEDVGQDLAGM